MKKWNASILVLAGAILLSAALVAGGLFAAAGKTAEAGPAPEEAGTDPQRDYRLEKLNEVNDMVLARKTVPRAL